MEYKHILSPVQVPGTGVTLKTRMTHTRSGGGLDNTPENFARSTRYYVTMARAGAATVNISAGVWPEKDGVTYHTGPFDHGLIKMLDSDVQKKFKAMIDAVHREGTLCMCMAGHVGPMGKAICSLSNFDELYGKLEGQYSDVYENKPSATTEELDEMVETCIRQAKWAKDIGFDGVTFHMCYRGGILAHSISPVANQRTDKYGGSFEGRCKLSLDIFKGIKEVCGNDFLIEIQQSAEEEQPGYDVEYWLRYCKACEGLVNIFQIRGFDMSLTHCTGFCCEKESPPQLKYAEAFRKRGIRALAAPVGGFGDPDTMESFLAEGKTDLIAMARAFIADNEIGQKLAAGRGEDVRPCLRCMGKCDFPTCTVNPYYAIAKYPEIYPAREITPKRVAVIGGGPAGMQAALTAAERGHSVTLYERRAALGGQLRFAENNKYKWQLRDYMYWLRRQIGKSPVTVKYQTEASPAMIKSEGYDAIILAMGSEAKNIPVSGAGEHRVFLIDEAYDHEERLGQRVVVIGGGATGSETALYLATRGHDVVLLTRKQEAYSDNNHCIYGEKHAYDIQSNLQIVEFATTTEIGSGYVVADVKLDYPKRKLCFNTVSEFNAFETNEYDPIPGFLYPEYPYAEGQMRWPETKAEQRAMAASGGMHLNVPEPVVDESKIVHEVRRYDCDSIVVAGGREPNRLAAEAFQGCAPEIYVVGDNILSRTVHEAVPSGFAAAMAL